MATEILVIYYVPSLWRQCLKVLTILMSTLKVFLVSTEEAMS